MARDETIKLSLIDGVTKSLTAIQKGVGGVGAELAKLNQVAELAGKGFAALGNIAGGIGDAVAGVADLETALARVVDITQATTEEQVALQQAVRDAATEVGVTADQAAGALVLMAEDGFTASEAVSSLSTVLSYAKANAQEAATATQALGGVLDTFGEKPQIIGKLADQLTAASRAAGTGAKSLQDGLAAIGIQAEQAGLSVGDAVAVLAALSARGREGTQAAKDVGTALSEINNPASAAAKALKEAGLSGRSFTEIIAVLSKDSAKAAPLLEALGKNPRAAMKLLLDEGGASLTKFQGIVNDTGDASVEAAKKVDETFNGAVARLQAAVGNLRNEFLSPILQPLADEAVALAEKINALGDSPQFARIRDQFQELATNAIRSVGDLIEQADLEAWAGDVADFAADAKRAFDDLVLVVETTADTIREIGAAIDYLRTKAQELDAYFGEADKTLNGFNVAAQRTGQSLSHLGRQLDGNKKSTREVAQATDQASGAADKFAGAVDEAGKAAGDAAEDMRRVPEAAKLVELGMGDVTRGADGAALSLDDLQARLAAVRKSLEAAIPGTPQFEQLSQQAIALERQMALTKQQIDQASDSTIRLANSAGAAAGGLREMAGAAGAAGAAVDSVGSSVSNTARETADAAGPTFTYTSAFDELDAAAQRADSSFGQGTRLFIMFHNQRMAAMREQISVLDERIARERAFAASTDKTSQIERALIAQYGAQGDKIKELARLLAEKNREQERSVELTEREAIATERVNAARAGQLGGFGAQQAAAAETPSATGGRGTAVRGGEGARGPVQVTVNVQGMTTDQAREFVERSVVPELERINRLSR